MNQHPDKFFREKLEGFHKPVPASAWGKIAAARHKKNNKGLWLKIAASLLLIGVATYLLVPERSSQEQESVAQQKASTPDPSLPAQLPQSSDSLLKSDLPDEQKAQHNKSSLQTAKADLPQPHEAEIRKETVLKAAYDSVSLVDMSSTEVIMSETAETQLAETSYSPAENITLVFTAEEVDEYLDKKSIDEATDSTKKPSTWKKLLKKANNLTNNQDPFGELRQKKNEILALNFKNEKQRDQNK